MALIGANGGLIGTQRSTNSSTAPGLWTPYEQVLLRRAGQWPLSGDPFFAYNSLSLHMDGTNGSTTFTDTSSSALAVTANGNAQISTAQSKFGGASALFDGTGDFLTTASNAVVALGPSDFTVEMWVRRTGGGSYRTFAGTRPDSGGHADAWSFGVGPSNELYIYSNAFICFSATELILLNTWHHVAAVRSGTNLKLYIDGVNVATGTNSQNFSRQILTVGGLANGAETFAGYIDDLRVTKGAARYIAAFTPPSGPFLDVGTGGEPYFPTTSVLLHMDGANGSAIFPDNGVDSRTITANGGVTVSTAQSKYGGASAFFNGTTDSLSFSDPGLGTGNFTIELWFRTASSVQYAQFIGNESPGYTLLINNSSSTSGDIGLYLGGLVCATSGTDYGDDAWHHLAVTRLGTAVTIWVDGVSRATGTSSATFSGQTNFVGRNNAISPRNLIGYIDDLRITKGIARYTGSFTPPTAAFLDVGTGGDPYFATTSLLHMDGTNGSTTFTDSGTTPKTITVNGGAQISTAQSKFGGASGYFDGSGDFLQVSSLTLGLQDFTVECWVRLAAITDCAIFNQGNSDSTGNFCLAVNSANGKLYFYADNSNRVNSTAALSSNTWYHVALTRQGQAYKLFIDGVLDASYTGTHNHSGTPFKIANGFGGITQLNGYIDDFRATLSVARYTATFTPPTAAFPEAGTGTGDSAFNYNSLLLHMEGSDNSTTFTDSSLNAFPVTPSGNARIKTDQFKYGTASGYFDGTGDYLDYTPNSAFAFGTADFTIEAWVRLQTYGGGGFSDYGGTLLDTRSTTGSSAGFILFVTTSGNLVLYVGSEQLRSTAAITLNTWTHIALVRFNSTATFYINGLRAGSVASSSNFTDTLCVIGSVIDGRANTTYLKYNGWLDEYRITKGIARYPGSFTPPTEPFPNA